MPLYPRPEPPARDTEVASIDGRLRVQLHRLQHAHLTESERETVWSVIDGMLGRRHALTTTNQENS